MKRIKILVFSMLAAMMLASCGTTQKVPLTGRTHRISVSDAQVLSLSNQEYTKYMASAKKSTNAAKTAQVVRVGKRLAAAVETYLKENGYANDLQNYTWEFNLVQDNSVNAFCMPGGKIVVYEGLLPVASSDNSLAIVLGHEIAHAVAKHSAEQLSKAQNQQVGTSILSGVLNQAVGNGVGDLAGAVAGQYFSFRNLKYSRENETEADYMGLIFAAMAGYDPQQAIPFWERMAEASGNQGKSDIFSDHPSDAKRIAALKAAMPTALKYYKPQGKTSVSTTKKTGVKTIKASSLMKKSTKNNDMMEYISQTSGYLDSHHVHLPHPGVVFRRLLRDLFCHRCAHQHTSGCDGCSVLGSGSGLGGMFRTQYPVDPSASGKGYP